MITFKQFLEESRSAPLYHATSAYNFEDIMNSNILKSYSGTISGTQRAGKPTVFFTRDMKHAKWYASRMNGINDSVIFEIDQLKLNQNYKLEPIHNWRPSLKNNPANKPAYMDNDYGYEFEEIVGKNITNFHRYVNA